MRKVKVDTTMLTAETAHVELRGKMITVETGKLAKQAHGAVLVRCEETVVLVTAVATKEPREGIDLFLIMLVFGYFWYCV
jgi:polyribonucleotide nucleotidyltransferase